MKVSFQPIVRNIKTPEGNKKEVREAILLIDGESVHIPKTSIGRCVFVPSVFGADHRGVCVYVWAKMNNISLSELQFEDSFDGKCIQYMAEYMNNPYHITNSLTNRFKHEQGKP